METERLILRPWEDGDAEELYRYAQDPDVGPIAGWPVHTSVENSLEIIHGVLSAPETYAVVLKETSLPVGSIGIMFGNAGSAPMRDNEAEIGYWIGKPYWGRQLIPEAVLALQKRCFEELGCTGIWCGYYEGNNKSKRVQEKCGFTYHHTVENVRNSLMGDIRTEHFTYLSKSDWILSTKETSRYRTEAVQCVNRYVLPEMKRQFNECNCDLDQQYKKYGDTEYFFAHIIEPGHVYEIGYPRCVCMKAQEEKDADALFCECSRQSILYVYENLIPDKKVTVETLETALTGGTKCRFKVVVE